MTVKEIDREIAICEATLELKFEAIRHTTGFLDAISYSRDIVRVADNRNELYNRREIAKGFAQNPIF